MTSAIRHGERGARTPRRCATRPPPSAPPLSAAASPPPLSAAALRRRLTPPRSSALPQAETPALRSTAAHTSAPALSPLSLDNSSRLRAPALAPRSHRRPTRAQIAYRHGLPAAASCGRQAYAGETGRGAAGRGGHPRRRQLRPTPHVNRFDGPRGGHRDGR